MNQIPTIIIRPSIVVGDSKTGETLKFDGPFFGLIMIDALKKFCLPLPCIGQLKAKVNLVPLDFVVQGTHALWLMPKALGKCFALADPNPPTTKELYQWMIHELHAKGPWGTIPPRLMEFLLSFRLLRKFLGVPKEVIEYYNHDVSFDTKNSVEFLREVGISCPSFFSYSHTLIKFYQENKNKMV
jgi:hypothetical protein